MALFIEKISKYFFFLFISLDKLIFHASPDQISSHSNQWFLFSYFQSRTLFVFTLCITEWVFLFLMIHLLIWFTGGGQNNGNIFSFRHFDKYLHNIIDELFLDFGEVKNIFFFSYFTMKKLSRAHALLYMEIYSKKLIEYPEN